MAARAGHLPQMHSAGAETRLVRHADPKIKIERRFSLIAHLGAATALGVGILVLAGWGLAVPVLKSVIPGLATMRANTALAFALTGVALWLQVDPGPGSVRKWTARGLSFAIATIGILTLLEYAFTIDLRIDTMFFPDPAPVGANAIAGRMALVTALCVALLGIALAGMSVGRVWIQKVAQALFLVVLGLGLMASIGHAYGVSALYGVAGYSQMAIHTALGFPIVAAGALAARPHLGFMRILSQANSAGATARRLTFIVGIAPILIGWIRLYGQHAGYYGTEFGLAVMVLVNAALLVSVVLWNGGIQGAAETERDRLMEELRFERASLEYQIIVRTRELTEMNKKLLEEEQRFHAIVANVPGIVAQMRQFRDGTTRHTFMSEGVTAILGWTPEQVMSNPALLADPDRPQDEAARQRVLQDRENFGKSQSREFRIRHKDGTMRWMESRWVLRQVENGEVAWDAITLDITETKRKEEELRASKELVTLITQTIPGVVFRREVKSDGSPSYTYFAGQLLEAFRITEQDALQNPAKLFELIHPDDRPMMLQSLDPKTEDLRPRTFVLRLVDPAGDIRWIEIQSRAEKTPDGRIFRNGIMVDVTQEKEAEVALEASERRYRAVVNNAPGVVFQQRQSPEGKVAFSFFSEQLQAVMGITPSEALTHPTRFDALFHPEELELRKRALKDSLATMSLREVDLRFMHPDGTYHWLHTRAVPHREPNGEIIWDGLAHDITDRHNLEDSLRHTERLQAIAQLSDGVAHHFNNLLAIIAGNVELLAFDNVKDSERKELIAKIETAVSRGAQVVDELRALSKYDPSKSGAVVVPALLQHLYNLAMPATGSGVELQLEVAPGLWTAAVDGSRLQTAILNLLFNARDAMPKGGRVVVAARNLPLDADAAGALRLSPGAYVEVSVKDNGVGMTQEVRERAINPFFTTKAPGQGVGLGLSMVHRFATQSGGAVGLQSTPGVGTEVRLVLPASPETVQAA